MHAKHAILIEIKRQCEKLKIQINIENSIDLSWVTEGSLFCLLLKLWQMNFIFNESVRMFNLAITFIVFISASDNSIATFMLYCELHTFRYIQHSLTSICYILNLLNRWKPLRSRFAFLSFNAIQNIHM